MGGRDSWVARAKCWILIYYCMQHISQSLHLVLQFTSTIYIYIYTLFQFLTLLYQGCHGWTVIQSGYSNLAAYHAENQVVFDFWARFNRFSASERLSFSQYQTSSARHRQWRYKTPADPSLNALTCCCRYWGIWHLTEQKAMTERIPWISCMAKQFPIVHWSSRDRKSVV